MATATFRIYSHWTALSNRLDVSWQGGTVNARGCIVAQGEGGYVLRIYFVDDATELPPSGYDPETLTAVLFHTYSEMTLFRGMFATTDPLYGYVDSVTPACCAVQTAEFPTAEVLAR